MIVFINSNNWWRYINVRVALGGLDPMVRIHLMGSQQVTTVERALEESRIFANAHRGHVVQASGHVDHYNDNYKHHWWEVQDTSWPLRLVPVRWYSGLR